MSQQTRSPITTISGTYVDYLQACEVEAIAWRAVAEALDRNPDPHKVWEAIDARDRAVIVTNAARAVWEAEKSSGLPRAGEAFDVFEAFGIVRKDGRQ